MVQTSAGDNVDFQEGAARLTEEAFLRDELRSAEEYICTLKVDLASTVPSLYCGSDALISKTLEQ